jgi:hypothetical protein
MAFGTVVWPLLVRVDSVLMLTPYGSYSSKEWTGAQTRVASDASSSGAD